MTKNCGDCRQVWGAIRGCPELVKKSKQQYVSSQIEEDASAVEEAIGNYSIKMLSKSLQVILVLLQPTWRATSFTKAVPYELTLSWFCTSKTQSALLHPRQDFFLVTWCRAWLCSNSCRDWSFCCWSCCTAKWTWQLWCTSGFCVTLLKTLFSISPSQAKLWFSGALRKEKPSHFHHSAYKDSCLQGTAAS